MTDLEVLRLSEPVEKMYLDCTSQLIINLCKHLKGGKKLSTTNWRVKKLSELGALTEESIEIIAANTGGKSEVIRETLNAALDISLADTEKTLTEAAKRGTVSTSVGSFKTSERVQTVLTNLVNQAVDDTNLVNTVMLSSVQQRYRAAIAQIAAYEEAAKEAEQIKRLTSASNLISLGKQMDAAQEVLNTAAGGTALGTTARTQAVRNAVKTLADKGITGFVDRGGHQWTPEAYVNMDVRTTVHNTALQGQKARAEDYDVHTFQVSTKAAARPLCAPYQGKILSWLANDRGTVYDLYGNAYEYTSIYDTSYGEPAGLFGINCGHFPNTFVDGYSIPRYKPLDEEGEKRNAEEYRISQEQRRLERDVRKAKTEALAYDAAGDKEAFEQTAAKVKHATKDYKAFCCSNELTERLDRVQVNGYNRSVSGKATWAARRQKPLTMSVRQQKPLTMAVGDKLTEAEERAIVDYVSAKSYGINAKLRAGETLTGEDAVFKRNLDYALAKLPDYSGTVYRSITSAYIDDMDAFNNEHQVGRVVFSGAYTSTSKSVYDETMDIQYVIQTKHGKDISTWNSNEQEVLHRRGTAFIVTKRDGNTIYMEEL